ncbi:Uncharacterised protein [uncultured archaeon]|nr:Uncharacterised protein [uncultured archaeon]
MNYIKQIALGQKIDPRFHSRFTRFSRGTFDGPIATLTVGKTAKVVASYDYVTMLGGILMGASKGPTSVTGVVTAKEELKPIFKELGIPATHKKSGGLFTAEIKDALEAEHLSSLYREVPHAFVMLSFSSGAGKIATKKKLPKPGGKVEADFVKADFNLNELPIVLDEIFFGAEKGVKKATVSNAYVITEFVVPDGVTDPAKIRIDALRKGVVKRTLEADGKTKTAEFPFAV